MFDNYIEQNARKADSRIVMVILDGLGGLPQTAGGKTELETASTPNLDKLAYESSLGLSMPAGPGVTVGSGPGHLAIFGYDPFVYEIGRGILEALGVDFEIGEDDIAARGNFCTLDVGGNILDRRAGRLDTEISKELIQLLNTIKIDGVEFFINPILEHRFSFVMRKKSLSADLEGTDPLKLGVPPREVLALTQAAKPAADLLNLFLRKAREVLKDKHPANMIMLRGFAKFPIIPAFAEKYQLKPAAIAVNGMYRGVSKLVGMDVLNLGGGSLNDEVTKLEETWENYDFFYMHYKKTDTCGESGDFDGKCRAIEVFDAMLPRILALNPNVLIITGDHSSPAVMRSHSWHPVPLLLHAKYVRSNRASEFGETACNRGALGIIPATSVMPLALAHAGRIEKFGA